VATSKTSVLMPPEITLTRQNNVPVIRADVAGRADGMVS
jgi:hypothetical protein